MNADEYIDLAKEVKREADEYKTTIIGGSKEQWAAYDSLQAAARHLFDAGASMAYHAAMSQPDPSDDVACCPICGSSAAHNECDEQLYYTPADEVEDERAYLRRHP